jgi:hypothetical protein
VALAVQPGWRLADASDIGAGTVESLASSVDLLCRAYPGTPPAALAGRLKQRLAYVLGLLGKRLTLRQHRDLLVQAGWLAMLLGCCHYDLGQREEAEAARQAASRMARQAGHGELLGWAHEMTAWFALVEHCYGDVIEAARTGQQATTGTSAAVQLVLQEAKAHACLGHGAGATRCLDAFGRARRALPLRRLQSSPGWQLDRG